MVSVVCSFQRDFSLRKLVVLPEGRQCVKEMSSEQGFLSPGEEVKSFGKGCLQIASFPSCQRGTFVPTPFSSCGYLTWLFKTRGRWGGFSKRAVFSPPREGGTLRKQHEKRRFPKSPCSFYFPSGVLFSGQIIHRDCLVFYTSQSATLCEQQL